MPAGGGIVNLWGMSGAELAREISQPAPVAVLQPARLADVLSQIAALPSRDQDELLRAFRSALKPARLTGGATFRDASDFFPAFNAAREAAQAVAGREWYLDPGVSLKARVPAAWVALRGEMGTWRSPRDVNFPRAEYWPGGVLPTGPEYAEHGPIDRGDAYEWKQERHNRGRETLRLDYTPEEIAA